jgi:hypothetical protein
MSRVGVKYKMYLDTKILATDKNQTERAGIAASPENEVRTWFRK